MVKVNSKSRIHIHWNVSPFDFSKEKQNLLLAKASKKYDIPKDRIKIIPEFSALGGNGSEVSVTKDIIQNIQDPKFQVDLFKEYLAVNKIENYDFELIQSIDAEINSRIDYKVYDKYRRYSIKWVKWSNFLSYGENNFFDFSSISGLVLLSGVPANQSGKTTFAIDLLHFLLFGKTAKVATQDKIFNKHLKEATSVSVEGCITIDNVDYIIKRTLTRPALAKRSAKSKTTQKVEYYKVIGDMTEQLEDYTENQGEDTNVKTNKVIKEAIGRESDFDLIMSVTESSLDDLVNKKDAERGRLLARWIGLLPLEEKEAIAREKFNTEVKPRLFSNTYDRESLKTEVEAFALTIKSLTESNEKISKANTKLDKEIEQLDATKTALLSSKQKIDDDVMQIDVTTLKTQIANDIAEGQKKVAELKAITDEIAQIGDVDFSTEKYDIIQQQYNCVTRETATVEEQFRSTKAMIANLQKSEYCPTCGHKLENVDNSQRIAELTKKLAEITSIGKLKRQESQQLKRKIDGMKSNREKFMKLSQLSMKKSALEVNVEKLRHSYKENMMLQKQYDRNSEAIDANNKIDIQIRNTDAYLQSKRKEKDTNVQFVFNNMSEIKKYEEQIKARTEIIEKIKQEEVLVRNWKIYLELIGKNGISKMVLRRALPIINAQLAQLLSDVCDFDIEVGITPRNDVQFFLIKDGVYSDLSSGSGFELTAAALALRAVLANMSTIPKCSYVTYDEILGRVARENYDNMKCLLDKIAKAYDAVLIISHNDEIKSWCNSVIMVEKEHNISRIKQYTAVQ